MPATASGCLIRVESGPPQNVVEWFGADSPLPPISDREGGGLSKLLFNPA